MGFTRNSKPVTRNSLRSALSEKMRVHFLLGLAKGRVGGPLAYLLLVVVAARAAHDVHGLQIVVAAVRIGWIVGERDAIE